VICFDSTYVGRLYLDEHGSSEVRQLAAAEVEVASSVIALAEVASILHRKLREGAISPETHRELAAQFDDDVAEGVCCWLPVTTGFLSQVRLEFAALPPTVYLRAADALHLLCAREAGFSEVYTNDRHMLAAATHFGLQGVNVIPALDR
jgi:predicted nucleic acid-binding protein